MRKPQGVTPILTSSPNSSLGDLSVYSPRSNTPFTPQTQSTLSNLHYYVAGLLVLINKWYQENAIGDIHQHYLKEAVLDCDPTLISAFRDFVDNNNKSNLIDVLLSKLPSGTIPPVSPRSLTPKSPRPDSPDMESHQLISPRQSYSPKPSYDDNNHLREPYRRSPSPLSPRFDRDDEKSVNEWEETGEIDEIDALGLPDTDSVKILASSLHRAGLNQLDLEDLWEVWANEAAFKAVSSEAYSKACASLASNSPDPDYAQQFYSTLFVLLDRNNVSGIDMGELLSAMATVSFSPLSQKLQFCFDVLDFDGDGHLSREEVFRYLYAVSAVLTTALYPDEIDPSKLRDETWSRAKGMFEIADLGSEIQTVTFTEWSLWANCPICYFS